MIRPRVPYVRRGLRRVLPNRRRTRFRYLTFQCVVTTDAIPYRGSFSYLPGFQHAEFVRYGVMHRNSFVDAPHTLDATFAIPQTRTRLAGQITGTEGYTEAIASGLLAALNTYADYIGAASVILPRTTALGSLVAYATDPETKNYQPMHVNFGIIAPLETPPSKKRERHAAYAERARVDLMRYLRTRSDLAITARYSAEYAHETL